MDWTLAIWIGAAAACGLFLYGCSRTLRRTLDSEGRARLIEARVKKMIDGWAGDVARRNEPEGR